jgi:dephospho-CoA kinase
MRIIGLTGGIATGKSTVSAMLRDLGAAVIDADEIAREVVVPGSPAFLDIQQRFPDVIGPDGRLDRAKLAGVIFSSAPERAALNAIIHPRIQQAILEKKAALAKRGVPVAILDAALLIEKGLQYGMDGLILVTAPRELQIARLKQRNGLSGDDAEARLSSQMPVSEKERFASWIIDNSGDLSSLRSQVGKVWGSIQSEASTGSRR